METIEANGARIPLVGLGTWQLRGKSCAAIVATAIRGGYRHIDTAAIYDNETEVGEGLRQSGVPRSELFVVTKVAPSNIRDGALQRSAEDSLRALKLDAVDLLLIHWPNPRVPLAESMGALNNARRRGLTQHIGVSNYDSALLSEAARLSEAPIVANQVEYHPYINQADTIAECREWGAAFVSYSPLALGEVLNESAVLAAARRLNRTPAQIVLRWHVQQGCVVIPKSAKPERIVQNAALFDFALENSEMAEIHALANR